MTVARAVAGATPAGAYPRLVAAGFRRYLAYWQASVAGLVTNVVFAMLRVAVLLGAVREAGTIAGYDEAAVTTYAWLSQGLFAVVLIWGDGELADRVRSGDVVVDLARPWNLQLAVLATDLGRAAFAACLRVAPPVLLGAALFPFDWPDHWWTWPLFAVSVVLATAVSSAARFLVDLATFWLMDVRGLAALYGILGGLLSGLTLPVSFFPDWAATAVWYTPFPAMLQTPVDVFGERAGLLAGLAHQVLFLLVLVGVGAMVQRAAERKLVVQGG